MIGMPETYHMVYSAQGGCTKGSSAAAEVADGIEEGREVSNRLEAQSMSVMPAWLASNDTVCVESVDG